MVYGIQSAMFLGISTAHGTLVSLSFPSIPGILSIPGRHCPQYQLGTMSNL